MDKLKDIDLDNPEFQNVWKLIQYTRRSVFLTGKAGTGKSTFLKYICANTSKKHVVLAPTGIAAVNVGGVTLHSFFKIPFKPTLPDDPEFMVKHLRKRMKYGDSFVKLLRKLELIIIDEISMVRADTIDFVDKILRVYTGNLREPFGGKQMLFVGDIFQLEPVVTGDMRDILSHIYPQPYFFNACVFKEMGMVSLELKKVYRQNDSSFISMLDRIRVGRPDVDDIVSLNKRLVGTDKRCGDDESFVMTLATRRDMVDAINSQHLSELKSPEVVYTGKISGDFPENSLPTSLELILKEGAQVVFIKNDIDRRWVNGTIGRIYKADSDRLIIELDSGERHSVEPAVWSNIKYEYDEKKRKVVEKELGSFTQFPVKLAWALTIHKSQGLTFKNVIIDVGHGTFAGGQTYVALSRCRSLEGLTLMSTVNERDIFVNPAVVEFSKGFNDTSAIDGALTSAKADDCYTKAVKAMDRGEVGRAFDLFCEAMQCRDELRNPVVRRYIRRRLSELTREDDELPLLRERIKNDDEKFRKLAMEYVAMGDECQREGMEPTPAIANYDKALSLWRGCVDAWIGKGRVYMGVNEPVEALDNYLIALDIDDRRPDLHECIAEVYDRVGDKKAASRHRAEAVKLRKKRGS